MATSITPETFNEALLGKEAPRAGGKSSTTSALFRVTYNGNDLECQIKGTLCRPYLSFYDTNAPGFNGKKGAFLSKPAGEVPVGVKQFKLNVDFRGARRAFHKMPDATEEDHYQLRVVRMVMAIENFIMNNCRNDLRKQNSKLPAGEFDVSPWANSSLVGVSVEGDPFYTDEKTKEQKLAPLTLSLTLYAKDRSSPTDPIVIDSAQCFHITGWVPDAMPRQPILSSGNFFEHCVGGANGFMTFSFGQPSIYAGKINAAPRPKNVFIDTSTRWGANHNLEPEQAAANAAIEW